MLMNFDVTLRQIEIFAGIARSGNLTVAAGELGISQSAASMALKELERAMDGPLFGRIGRGLVLNGRGRLVLPFAERVLTSVRNFVEVGRTEDDPSGELVVSCSTTIANYLFPLQMKAFMDRYPGVSVVLRVGNTMEIEEDVRRGTADLGLVEGELGREGLSTEEWTKDELVIFCSPEHPFAGDPDVAIDRLADERWIIREEGSGTLSTLMEDLKQRGVRLSRTLRIGHTEAIKRAVESGMGISCLSRFAVERELAWGKLVLVKSTLRPHRWFRIVTRGDDGGPAFGAMLRWLREHRGC